MNQRTSTLIVAHRRVDTAQQVAKAVVDAGITDVWAWVDGPRTSVEAEQTTAVVTLLESQEWPGEFHLLKNDLNHGVARAVPAALDWVFAHRDEAVVLEDDCVPTVEFFDFVDLMIERYRNNPRVALISGTRIGEPLPTSSTVPYQFSTFPLIWGWATWRNRWAHYEHDIRGWRRQVPLASLVKQGGVLHAWDWYRLFNSVATKDPWSWDYQLTYMLWSHSQVTVVPSVDLVQNVGFGEMATHTGGRPQWAPQIPSEKIRKRVVLLSQKEEFIAEPDLRLDREIRRSVFSPPIRSRFLRRAALGYRRVVSVLPPLSSKKGSGQKLQ
jgi:hypothetical protein